MADPYKDQLKENGAKTYSGYDLILGYISKTNDVFESVGGVINVIAENWKLVAIGVVALAVLLKD